jgi:hypothetical protein
LGLDAVEDFFGEVERHCGELFHFSDHHQELQRAGEFAVVPAMVRFRGSMVTDIL